MTIYLVSLVLIFLSACFSGLTLGYFSLHKQTLRRQAKHGNQDAIRVLKVRENSNQLLTTLLLGNVAVNTILSVYLSSIASGALAALFATVLIFIFGEILPQAAFARHALRFGAIASPYVRILLIITSPITYPIARLLDRLLGQEVPAMYSKFEIMEIVSEHEDSEHSTIDQDEERIVHGALQFSHKTVREVMTPKELVHAFEINERLTPELIAVINEHNYSRYPVYSGNQENIVGILYTKDLLGEDDDIPLGQTTEALERNFLSVSPSENLDVVLAAMLKKRKHMAIVKTKNSQYLGLITLEDIIEEIIQFEIEDEDDTE